LLGEIPADSFEEKQRVVFGGKLFAFNEAQPFMDPQAQTDEDVGELVVWQPVLESFDLQHGVGVLVCGDVQARLLSVFRGQEASSTLKDK
jgi:hypothetical protein